MRHICGIMLGAAALAGQLLGQSASAQTVGVPGGFVPAQGIGYGAADASWTPVTPATPLPTAAKQEAFTLVSANAPAAAVTVYGGNYALSQACASYGTVTVRYRGPDGASMLTLLSKTSADGGGATPVSLGTNAVVDTALSGTTGCNVTLSRIP